MKVTKYDRFWDKLARERWTTIRNRFSWQAGRQIDKLDYYKTREIYKQIIADKEEFDAKLVGIDITYGNQINENILLADIMYKGRPDMDWYKKVREMKQCLVLDFKKVL